ncbi:helix-turn-helix domain-containing protein [Rhodococcus qingshengii]|uniref:helix-turn-helix domain-containing protein n=1 Tax=Rhodococcus qingshengii TaxID=334542 RepID=UPI001ADF8426|nr:helix-turn-helix transcriptional regulator [Rhodococcus qingshengii]MCQ4148651.1 helix-turn-helix domain-containing protein [Rhodococcus qingshengii]
MTQTETGADFATRYATPQGQQGLAAAELCMDVIDLLNEVEETAGTPRKELAALLGVTPGRISQVLNGDGNITVAALARLLRAMGHEAVISARAVDPQDIVPFEDHSIVDPEVELIESVQREIGRFVVQGTMKSLAVSAQELDDNPTTMRTQRFETR